MKFKVDLARDRQANCRSCEAPCYWIKTNAGKWLLVSEATSERDDDGQVWMAAHFSDCPEADEWRKNR